MSSPNDVKPGRLLSTLFVLFCVSVVASVGLPRLRRYLLPLQVAGTGAWLAHVRRVRRDRLEASADPTQPSNPGASPKDP